jgi:hypothetical protein
MIFFPKQMFSKIVLETSNGHMTMIRVWKHL